MQLLVIGPIRLILLSIIVSALLLLQPIYNATFMAMNRLGRDAALDFHRSFCLENSQVDQSLGQE